MPDLCICVWKTQINETAHQPSITSQSVQPCSTSLRGEPVCAPAKTLPHWGWLSASIPRGLKAQRAWACSFRPWLPHFCKCNLRSALPSYRSALSHLYLLAAHLRAAALSFNTSVQQINSSSERGAGETRILAISPALFLREWLPQVFWTRRGK